jgi:putative methylase
MSIRSKRDLEVELSKLKVFSKPLLHLEQYQTPPKIASDWIWSMAMQGEIAGKTFLDAGCGNGILGIGLLLMGAKKIFFLDIDNLTLKTCQENYNKINDEYEIGDAEFVLSDISLFDHEVDCVVENPPFGTKEKHVDKKFLKKAFSVAKVVYSMHKYTTKQFVEAISKDNGFIITHHWRYYFPIKATFHFHKKSVKDVDVGLWRMEKE